MQLFSPDPDKPPANCSLHLELHLNCPVLSRGVSMGLVLRITLDHFYCGATSRDLQSKWEQVQKGHRVTTSPICARVIH